MGMKPLSSELTSIEVVDSHTAGEPTRVVIAGGPELGAGDLRHKLHVLRTQHDDFRRGVLLEPRGSNVLVGALLCEPNHPSATAAVIYFNDVGYLGMCGHGTIGVVTTLAHLGRISHGIHMIQTPVGFVETLLHRDGTVSFQNVPSYRYRADVAVDVPGFGSFRGDIAWGGNWFFLVADHSFELQSVKRDTLMAVAMAMRSALHSSGITGKDGAAIDHVELFGPPVNPENSSRNFVLCPGAAFDRSPCGTGTSAKLACLFADGKLALNTVWRQEGILGTVFEGSIRKPGDSVTPTITGRSWITAHTSLFFHPSDPFRSGINF